MTNESETWPRIFRAVFATGIIFVKDMLTFINCFASKIKGTIPVAPVLTLYQFAPKVVVKFNKLACPIMTYKFLHINLCPYRDLRSLDLIIERKEDKLGYSSYRRTTNFITQNSRLKFTFVISHTEIDE